MLKKAAVVGFAIALGACGTPANVKQIQDQNATLQGKLSAAEKNIVALKNEQSRLQQDIAEYKRVIGVLGTEKNSRVSESTSLRGQVRGLVQSQIDGLKDFLVEGNLLDYVGGELVARSQVDEKPVAVVDLANPVPKAGVLTGVGAFWQQAGTLSVQVLRPIEKELVVIWSSKDWRVDSAGYQRHNFSVNVGVEKGDVIAYSLSTPQSISFDIGTGDTRYLSDDLSIGDGFRASGLKGAKERRAYSLGVFALLNN